MNARHAKNRVREWVRASLDEWPGLRGAHFVGGITTMPDDAPIPAHKDVDLHLIFDEGSPALAPTGPFLNVIEDSHAGVSIEAGVKSVVEYRTPEAVLSNPEVAHHLTVDSLIHDPTGWLRCLQDAVRLEYPRRRWVLARLAHERAGHAGALELRAMVASHYGASGEVNILGYLGTFVTAALSVATLNPPRMGGRTYLRLRELLAAHDRLDLYAEQTAILGLDRLDPEQVTCLLGEGAEMFDLALRVKRSPHPFQHKLHGHLRSYFVETCRELIAEGHHHEAMAWVLPYHLATADVI